MPIRKVKAFFTTRAIAEATLLEQMKNYPFILLVLGWFYAESDALFY